MQPWRCPPGPRPPQQSYAGSTLRFNLDASLTADLRSAHASREAIEAELTSLRSLTDARIKHFMGWH